LANKQWTFDSATFGISSLCGRVYQSDGVSACRRRHSLGAIFRRLVRRRVCQVYVGLRAGLTVSASIPISVLSILYPSRRFRATKIYNSRKQHRARQRNRGSGGEAESVSRRRSDFHAKPPALIFPRVFAQHPNTGAFFFFLRVLGADRRMARGSCL